MKQKPQFLKTPMHLLFKSH